MALVHCDPFAHYTAAQYTDAYSVGGFGATLDIGAYGRDGRPGLRFSGDEAFSIQRLSLSTSGAVCIFQADFRISAAAPVTNVLFAPLLGGSIQCSVDLNTDRTLAVHRGFAGTKTQLGSNSTYVVPLDTTIHLAAKFTIADGTSGSIVVHVWEDDDSVAQVVLNVTGVDTKEGASATWDGFNLGSGNDGNTDWSNLVVMDGSGSSANDFLGPADVWALWANAREASALTDWTLSSGSDAAALTDDATPDDDTTYLEETTQNQQMTVAVDAVPYPGRAILGAQLYASVKLTSGSPSLRGIGYESATPNLGVTFAPTSSYTYLMGPYSAMPSGAAFSTAAAFDALQWGLKLTTTSTGARVTQIVVALIQSRTVGNRNLVVGYGHTVSGDDNVASGQSNTVTGSTSQAHGASGTVIGDRSVLFNLDGTPRTLTGNGKFEVYGEVGGDIARADRSYLTEDDETATLPNSRRLLAGTNVTFDDSTPGERTIDASGGSGNATGSTAHGSEPGSPTSGDLDLYTNSFYIARYSGSVWAPWGPIFPMTPPVSGDFSWVNQGSAAIDTTFGGVYLSVAANGGAGLRERVKSAPSTPYTITAAFLVNAMGGHGGGGLLFRQSSDGKVAAVSKAGASTNLQVNNWNTATSFSATVVDIAGATDTFGRLHWYQISDDGSNRIMRVSADGQHWIVVYSIARTTFLTADQVGFWVIDNAFYDNGVTLLSWKET